MTAREVARAFLRCIAEQTHGSGQDALEALWDYGDQVGGVSVGDKFLAGKVRAALRRELDR